MFMSGLCGGEISSTIHTKVGEQPDELTLELAQGSTWYNQDPAYLPRPLELKSVDAGKGWAQLGPTDGPGKPLTVAIVFEDPSIDASNTEIFHGHTTDLVVKGTSFRHRRIIKRDGWVYHTVPPILVFDPPIDPEIVKVFVNTNRQVTVAFQQRDYPQWAPTGYFGPLKIKGMDTGAGMVVLDPPVTVANVVPGSPYEFFMLKRINQLREDGAIKHYQERVDQAAREWRAMTSAEKTQFVSATRIEISCMKLSCFLAEPRQLKVVAIDTDAGLVRLNPEDGGVVVITVKPGITVQQDENLLIYQSTKEVRIAGSGFEENMEASEFTPADPSLLPMALLVSSVKASPGTVDFGLLGLFPIRKVATVFEDASIQARNTEIYRSSTRELNIYGTGFNNVVQPILVFAPPLDDTAVDVHGIDTGAGMIFFDSPVTVAIVSPNIGTHYDNVAQFISSTYIAITRNFSCAIPPGPQVPSPWRAEPGPLKIVAIDNGAGRIPLNPEDGGVVVATVSPIVRIKGNEDLHIYQSTKQIQVAGGGFDNDIETINFWVVSHLGGKVFHVEGDDDEAGAGDVEIDTLSASQMTITLTEGSVWVKDLNVLPGVLRMGCEVRVEIESSFFLGSGSSLLFFGGPIATVFEEPSIDASDIEINRTGSQELEIWGTGFNNMATPVMDFDPPLDFASLHVNVVNRTTIQLTLDTAQSGWVPVEQLGPLKIKGVDTGAGMVVFDAPVTVATVVPDSEPFFNQGFHVDLDAVELNSRKSATPSLHEEENAAEPETEEFGEKVDGTVVPTPSVEASSTVIYMGSTDSLAVKGNNFDMATRLIFNPPLGTGFEMRVFSRTEIDIFTKTVIGRGLSTWGAEPGPLKVVAIDTGAGLVQLNPEDGGVVVAIVR
ncbi:unnamed protein product [Ectocarpus sp. 6 AP-2014]